MMTGIMNSVNAIKKIFCFGFVGACITMTPYIFLGCVNLQVADYDNTKKYGIEGNSYGLHPIIFNGLHEKDSNFIICLTNENYNGGSPFIEVSINEKIIYDGNIYPYSYIDLDWYVLGVRIAPKKTHVLKVKGYLGDYKWGLKETFSIDKAGFAHIKYEIDETKKLPGKITITSMEGSPFFY